MITNTIMYVFNFGLYIFWFLLCPWFGLVQDNLWNENVRARTRRSYIDRGMKNRTHFHEKGSTIRLHYLKMTYINKSFVWNFLPVELVFLLIIIIITTCYNYTCTYILFDTTHKLNYYSRIYLYSEVDFSKSYSLLSSHLSWVIYLTRMG